jgi:hypothetical protein
MTGFMLTSLAALLLTITATFREHSLNQAARNPPLYSATNHYTAQGAVDAKYLHR